MMGIFQVFKKKKVEETINSSVENIQEVKPKSKKRKTIPQEVKEFVKEGKDDEVKSIMKKCQVNAYDTYYKNTILCYEGISSELVQYFIEEGYDINYVGRWDETPLHKQASNRCHNLQLYIDLGADIHAKNYMDQTPLHCAAMYSKLDNIKVLVEAGADVNALNKGEGTPLQELLSRMTLFHADTSLASIRYLLDHGARITPTIQNVVKKIGEDFEFHKSDCNKDVIEEMQETLVQLYQLFDVEPIAPRILHDGKSPIEIHAKTWQKAHEELWQLLVPGNGHASTIQGELVRISGRLSYEILDNGGCNWDGEYRKMVASILPYMKQGILLSIEKMEELDDILRIVMKGKGECELDRLVQLMVEWVSLNENPISLTEVNYKR